MIPKFLVKMLKDAQEHYDNIKVLRDTPSMVPRVMLTKKLLEMVQEDIAKLEMLGQKEYSDEDVIKVLDSGLDAVKGSKEHVALAISLNMKYGSLIYFLEMRDFCLGGKWVNTQERVSIYMAKGNMVLLNEIRERNQIALEECMAKAALKKVKKAANL